MWVWLLAGVVKHCDLCYAKAFSRTLAVILEVSHDGGASYYSRIIYT